MTGSTYIANQPFEYKLDYFSGAQANIYLGPILLDEVTSLQWSVHQAKIPIYGYASQFFNEMARGSVIVQGQFSINFIQPNYLFSVMHALKNKKGVAAWELEEEALDEKLKEVLEELADDNTLQSRIEQWRAIKDLDKKNKGKANEFFFKKINDTLWGPSELEKTNSSRGRTDDTAFNGFDIEIQYKWENDQSPQASQTIKNVHILGSSRAIMIDEQPIQEVYSFYAQRMQNDPRS